MIYASSISNTSGQANWSGIINGTVYGSSLTITKDASIPSGENATIKSGESLTVAEGVTLTNNGTIYQDYGSTLTGISGSGTIHYEVDGNTTSTKNYTISGNGVTTNSSKTYSKASQTVTVTPAEGFSLSLSVQKKSNETVETSGKTFTMPPGCP